MSDWYVNTHRCFIMSMMYILILVDLHLKYYTDWHAVDEDMITISAQGGWWFYEDAVGAVAHDMDCFTSYVTSHVAYKDKNSTPVTESRVLNELFKFVDMSNYEGTMYYCVYRTLK